MWVFAGIAFMLLAAPAAPESAPAQERDLCWFLRRLRTVDHLPILENSHTALSSTWSRAGAISDPNDFKRIEGTRNILLDVDGPGCIHRIFTGRLGSDVAGTRIQIILDSQPEPVFDMTVDEFFDDRAGPLPYPLVFHKTYPGTLFPIPFARHCVVQLVNPERRNWGCFWQVAYTIYPRSTPVRSLNWPLQEAERQELQEVCRTWLDAEAKPPQPPPAWTLERVMQLPAGETARVQLPGCGIVRECRVAVEPAEPEVLRGLRMRLFWDGVAEPSVDVPVGYFFGHADHGCVPAVRFSSLLLGVTEDEAWSRIPMPFSKGAVWSFENRSSRPVSSLRLRLAVESREQLPPDMGRLHATWREKRAAQADAPRYGALNMPVHMVLERPGRGKYVGVLLHVVWPHQKEWWGEGDWLIWTDEDGWPPSYHGTGTEEYFNSGWSAFDRKAVSGYVATRPGHETVYSFHLNDAFQWQRSARVAVETAGWVEGDEIIRREHPIWGSTAWWYATPPQPAGSTPELISPR